MVKTRKKIIRIEWSEPYLIEDAIQADISKSRGLYYITSVFGAHETSRYIGKATRTIKERLVIHNRDWVHNYRGKIYVRIGKIIYPQVVDSELIDHAESALIYEHRDILTDNTDKRYSYSYSETYIIENMGNRFQLKPRIDMYEHPDL